MISVNKTSAVDIKKGDALCCDDKGNLILFREHPEKQFKGVATKDGKKGELCEVKIFGACEINKDDYLLIVKSDSVMTNGLLRILNRESDDDKT